MGDEFAPGLFVGRLKTHTRDRQKRGRKGNTCDPRNLKLQKATFGKMGSSPLTSLTEGTLPLLKYSVRIKPGTQSNTTPIRKPPEGYQSPSF
jgi:hypothetical protein